MCSLGRVLGRRVRDDESAFALPFALPLGLDRLRVVAVHQRPTETSARLAEVSAPGRLVSKLWGSDPERMWPWARRLVAPVTVWLAPSYGYGLERMPETGGGVAAINHLSAIDPPLVGSLSPRTLYFMAKAELLDMPVVGDVLTWTGTFPVRRGEGDRESLRLARQFAREGHMVGVFVEGTRQKFGYPGAVLPGAMMIALQEEVPVVPCGVYSFGWSRKNRMPCAIVSGRTYGPDCHAEDGARLQAGG